MKIINSYVDTWFNKLTESLDESVLNEAKAVTILPATSINLAQCKKVTSDIVDIRGELETSACINYQINGATIFSRIAAQALIYRYNTNSLEFLAKNRGQLGIDLPGGGYDPDKDRSFIDTIKREIYEELNIKLNNIKDTGVAFWRSESDKDIRWVNTHIPEKDRFHGYYTELLIAEYAGESDNDLPEEVGRYKWWPIDLLDKNKTKKVAFYKQAADQIPANSSLSEAWGNEHGEYDYTIPNTLSYCVATPMTLQTILETNQVKVSDAPETHEFDIAAGKTRQYGQQVLAKYHYVSFSEQLFSHAWRRPTKWGFGIVVDKESVENAYDLTSRSHEYKEVRIKGIYKTSLNNYYLKTTTYGLVLISEQSYNWLKEDLKAYSELQQENAKQNNKIVKKGIKEGEVQANGWRLVNKQSDRPNAKIYQYLEPDEKIVDHYEFNWDNASYAMPFIESMHYQEILNELLNDTWFNEGELRIWVKDPTIKYIKLDNIKIIGIILPAIFSDCIKIKETPIFEYISNYVKEHNIEIYYHHAFDPVYCKYSKYLEKQQNFEKSIDKDKYNTDLEYKINIDKERKHIYRKALMAETNRRRYRNDPNYVQSTVDRVKAYRDKPETKERMAAKQQAAKDLAIKQAKRHAYYEQQKQKQKLTTEET